jgi:hypothetical protein
MLKEFPISNFKKGQGSKLSQDNLKDVLSRKILRYYEILPSVFYHSLVLGNQLRR